MSKICLTIFSVLSILTITRAYAGTGYETGTVNITGNLLPSTCSISGASDLTFALGNVSQADLPDINATFGRVEQAISLRCDADTGVYMTVSGDSVADSPAIIENKGTGKGVGVQLLDVSNNYTPISLGERWMVIQATEGDDTIPLAAQYIRTGTLDSGTVTASVTYNLDYE
ncbi:fimbrial protein [Pseudescherichia sp.]|uniref:fimbrial protein n=1 Tax=Pseudescherichia sp. TaxID=2055881 RepID=UPI00289AD848|nr:fimbrial protein [Pseudescherichia sp.]